MAQPPTPEGFAGGLANPAGGGRRGLFDRVTGRNRPMISVDPATLNMIGRVKDAVRGLTSEVQKLATEAERYARAMGHATGRPFTPGGGARPANFPEIMRPGEAAAPPRGPTQPPTADQPGPGGRRQDGMLTPGEEFVVGGYARDVARAVMGQIGAMAQRESLTTRMAMAMPGQYDRGGGGFFGGGARDLQQMARREAYGYTSTGELYGGTQRLQELGLLRGMGQRDRDLMRQASTTGRITGTGFGGGVEAMAAFRAPQMVNQMQQFGITAPFQGGNMQMFGQQGMLEQITSLMTRGLGREQQEGFLTGPQAQQWMESMGMAPEQQRLVTQYGAARAEMGRAPTEEELQKRFKDTGESLKDLQEAFTELMDTLSTGLVPIIKGMNFVLKPLADGFAALNEIVPRLEEAIGLIVAALLAWQAKVRIQSALSMVGIGAGPPKGGPIAAGGRVLAGAGGLLGGLGAGGTLLATGGMLAGGLGGSWAGRKVGGEGWKGKAGSVLGGAAGGAAIGAGLGLIGGPLAPLTSTAGAIAGGVIGGVAGLFGDAWPDAEREGIGDNDATPKEPSGPPASGMELPGAKAGDQNMNPEFVNRLKKMFADNPKLTLTSGWRDSAEQARLFKQKPHLAAPPGRSNHERGTAADLGPQSQWGWIGANLGKYGLFLPMPPTAERRSKGKKIEPWHVEPVGLTGKVPTQAAAGAAAYAEAPVPGAAPGEKAKAKPKSPEAGPAFGGTGSPAGGGIAYQVATDVTSRTGGTQIGDAWEGYGDNEVSTYGGTPVSRRSSITIGKIEINLTIARGTPEEAERTARYLGTLLGDRERMLALARNGGKN